MTGLDQLIVDRQVEGEQLIFAKARGQLLRPVALAAILRGLRSHNHGVRRRAERQLLRALKRGVVRRADR